MIAGDSRSAGGGTALTLQRVTKRFGAVVAVDRVDLEVRQGEIVTLLGPSGSGKTTILRMVAGFEQPTAGRILLDGSDVAPLSPAERQVGVIFQHYALFPHMTVADNIRYPLKRRGWARPEREARLGDMIALVDLSGLEDRYPRQLSGGQQQRVALARALAFRPGLLLMDEPLGALDRALRADLEEEIRRIHRETQTTMVYVTHDQEEALTLSDRIAVMRHGQIIQIGNSDELYERPAESFVAEFFGECNLLPVDGWTRLADGRAEVVKLGGRFRVIVCGEPEDEAVLVVRPARLQLVGPAGALVGSTDGPPTRQGLTLKARVLEMLYLGEIIRMRLLAADGTKLLARIDTRHCAGVHLGDEVVIGFKADDAVLVRRTAPPSVEEMALP